MGVSFYDHKIPRRELEREIKDRIELIINQHTFIEGDFNIRFENAFAKLQKAPFCLLVGNGTDALEISLRISGVGPLDWVGVPGVTFKATAEAVLNVGARPLFIDIDPETGLISLPSLKRLLSQYPLKAIIPVHLYGLPAPIEELEQICLPLTIPIIEDAAQACGTFLDNEGAFPVGSRGHLTIFSFYPTKNLSAFGDAGCILTGDEGLAKKINSSLFPGIQGGPLQHVIAGKAVCFREALAPEFKVYQEQVLKNAHALAASLQGHGVSLVSGGTDNHLLLVKTDSFRLTGKEAEKILEDVHLTCNKNMIPNDKRSPFITSGIRLGTAAITSRGLMEKHMEKIAAWIYQALTKSVEHSLLRKEVVSLCRDFPVY